MDGRALIVRKVSENDIHLHRKKLNCGKKHVAIEIFCQNSIAFFPDKNECDLDPCLNNGTCRNTLGSYNCDCTEGWQDHDCQRGSLITLL